MDYLRSCQIQRIGDNVEGGDFCKCSDPFVVRMSHLVLPIFLSQTTASEEPARLASTAPISVVQSDDALEGDAGTLVSKYSAIHIVDY